MHFVEQLYKVIPARHGSDTRPAQTHFQADAKSVDLCSVVSFTQREYLMRTYFKPLHTLIFAGALSTLAGYSMAQPVPGTGLGAGPAAQSQGMGQHDPARMQAHMVRRLAEFKAKLMVTPAQEAAWTTYTDALKPTPRATTRTSMAAAHAELSKLPTPERLDRMRTLHAERMAEMTARMDQRAQATKSFYAVLSPDQQKIFDTEYNRAVRGHGGHRMGRLDGQHGRYPG